MCRPAGWSRNALRKKSRKFHVDFSRVTPLPSLTRATEAPGGLSLGFFTLSSPDSHPVNATSIRLFRWSEWTVTRACVRSFVIYLTIDAVLKYVSNFIHKGSLKILNIYCEYFYFFIASAAIVHNRIRHNVYININVLSQIK